MFDNSQIQLNERAETLLQLLIRRYIDQGEPVGSRTLSREPGLGLSPATIRNVMSDLEELGLIRSPHTSAGRVPTQLGYRIFVDTMMKVKPLNNEAIEEISGGFARAHDPNELGPPDRRPGTRVPGRDGVRCPGSRPDRGAQSLGRAPPRLARRPRGTRLGDTRRRGDLQDRKSVV